MSEPSTEFVQTFRADLAALCCAGAFVSQPDIWESFIEWVKAIDPESSFVIREYSKAQMNMMLSVMRTDKIIMLASILQGTSDQEIETFLEGQ